MWGIFGKPLKRAIRNTPGLHAVLAICLRFSSVLDDACVAHHLVLPTGSYHGRIQIQTRAVASPDAPQQPLVRKRAHSGGANWVCVTYRTSPSNAKRPRIAGSQQPTCTDQEHQILTTGEAASFANQFWDCKVHPKNVLQHKFLATCIDVDLEKDVKHAQ